MTAILLRRGLRLLVVCFGISLVTFLLMHLSGDPVAMILPEATEADRAVLRERNSGRAAPRIGQRIGCHDSIGRRSVARLQPPLLSGRGRDGGQHP